MLAASSEAASLFESLTPKQKSKWRRLLHFHGGESRIDSYEFFVHPRGHEDEVQELSEFVRLYKENSIKTFGRAKLSLACAYPARVKFLEEVGLIQKKTQACPNWENWQREVNPKSLSVVFSTAYPNNPGSMFGHTFLRFHNAKEVNDLLDYGANYAALTDESDIGVVYAFKGIFGGYRGFFDLAPYYVKVNEYNHGENRDLIEYELSLSNSQVEFLLAHLWELYQGASFDYFFTYENCSFHLSDFINVALGEDENEALEVPHRWYYLPVDLIHALKKYPNLIKTIRERPSQMRKVRKLVSELSSREESQVKEALKTEDTSKLSPKERRVLASLLDLEKFKKKEKFKRSAFVAKNLKALASSGKKFEKLKYKTFSNRPHQAHEAQKVYLGASQRKDIGVLFGYQSGYHELLARDLGLERFSQFRFLGFRANYNGESQKLRLEEFSLIDVVSLHPWSWYHSQLSWRVGVWMEDVLENQDCRSCQRVVATGKMGLSFGEDLWIASLLLGLREEATDSALDLDKVEHLLSYELLLGLSVNAFKGLISFEGRHNSDNIKQLQTNVLSLGLNYAPAQNWEVRFKWEAAYFGKNYDIAGERGALTLGHYF